MRHAATWLALFFHAAAAAQQWTSIGPSQTTNFRGSTGRVSAIACSPTDANTYFVAGADGGVWKSTNGGAGWTPLTDQMATTAIGALLIDPANPAVMYAGSGEANFANHSRPGEGVYRSLDGGANWTQFGAPELAGRCISRLAMDAGASPRLYAAVTRAGGFPGPTAAKGHPGANGPRGVWMSADRGVSWSRLTGLVDRDITDFAIEPGNANIMYAAVGTIAGSSDNGVWKSEDRGTTWARVSGGLPAAGSIGRVGLGISPAMPARVYAFMARPADAGGGSASTLGAYRSDDRGLNWSALAIGDMQATYGWYFTTVGVNPANAAEVNIAALVFTRSVNSGASFSNLDIPHPDVHAIAYDAAGRMVVGCDGGVYRYSGGAWSTLNTGLTLTQCMAGLSTHPIDDNVMFVGLQDNGSLKRTGDSTVWLSVTGGDGGWTQVDQSNPSRVFTESQGTGNLYRSTDGGVNFSPVGAGISGNNCFLPPFLIDPANPMRMLYATERVWVSTSGGDSFAPLSPDLTGGASGAAIRSLAIAPSDSRYVYAATNNGRVLVSANGGTTFTLIRTNNPGWPRVTRELFVDPSDPRTLYLAAAGYGTSQVLRTRDAGSVWESLDAGLPDVPVNTVAADSRVYPPRIYAGTEAGVYWTLDEGATWEVYGSGLPRALVNDIRLEPSRNRLVAGTQGRGVWSVEISACIADFNHDGGTDGADVEDFFLAWEASESRADVNADGGIDGSDVETFFRAWEAGC